MKFLFTADWHFSNSLPHAKLVKNGETDRLMEQRGVVERIVDIASEHKVEAVFVLGDLFDRRMVDAVTLEACTASVRRVASKFPVYVLSGNHEASGATSERFLTESLAAIENVTVMRSQCPVFNTVQFFPVYWCQTPLARERIAKMREFADSHSGDAITKVLLLHHSINGCSDGNWLCDKELDPDEVCSGWDLVLSGHFHTRQRFGGVGSYVGAPMYHDFGDHKGPEDIRGVLIVEFGREIEIIEEPVYSPGFFTWDYLSGNPPPAIEHSDYLRIDVHCDHQQRIAVQAELANKVREFELNGIRVLPPKHIPATKIEGRLGNQSGEITHIEVCEKYLDKVSHGLDRDRLIEMAKKYLEASRG